ncbi:hypothetical protein SCA6_018667 [Theobroma cacao]
MSPIIRNNFNSIRLYKLSSFHFSRLFHIRLSLSRNSLLLLLPPFSLRPSLPWVLVAKFLIFVVGFLGSEFLGAGLASKAKQDEPQHMFNFSLKPSRRDALPDLPLSCRYGVMVSRINA